jgi:hypothetical protein
MLSVPVPLLPYRLGPNGVLKNSGKKWSVEVWDQAWQLLNSHNSLWQMRDKVKCQQGKPSWAQAGVQWCKVAVLFHAKGGSAGAAGALGI